VFSARWVDTDLPRPRWRFTGTYRFTPRLQAGLEWNPAADEVGFIGNYMIAPETDKTPMVNLGTSSDRIGTPKGPKAYYVTLAKGFPEAKIGAYVSLNYSEFDRGFNLPFGATYQIAPGWSTMFMNDGRKSHLLLTHSTPNWSASLMWIWFKHPGVSISWGF
jgi:hypothetical protein